MKEPLAPLDPTRVRIVHISDTHLSEVLYEDEEERLKLPHRYGHRNLALSNLDQRLKELEFDILVASGDLTRVGSRESLKHFRDWLWRPPEEEGGVPSLALDLRRRGKHVVVVPGNHDRFGGTLTQAEGLDNYGMFFTGFHLGSHPDNPIVVRGRRFVFHRFDSSDRHGTFGRGSVNHAFLKAWRKKDPADVHVAVTHHHCLAPAEMRLRRNIEMSNAKDVLEHFLAYEFAAVLYGHTHRGFFSVVPAGSALRLSKKMDKRSNIRRRRRSIINKLIRLLSPSQDPGSFFVYPCRNRKYVAMDARIDYLYYVHVEGIEVKGPEDFTTPAAYYVYLDEFERESGKPRVTKTDILEKRRVAFSMAPSACQYEVPDGQLGFHVLDFVFDEENRLRDVECVPYFFEGGEYRADVLRYENIRSLVAIGDWGVPIIRGAK